MLRRAALCLILAAVAVAGCSTAVRPRVWLGPPPGQTRLAALPDSVTLYWAGLTISGLSGFYVLKNGTQVEDLAGTTASSYTFTDLSCGQTYTLGVEAHDSAGNHGPLWTMSYTAPACASAAPLSAVWFTGYGAQNLSSLPWADISEIYAFSENPCDNGSSPTRTCNYTWLTGANGDEGMGNPLNLGTFVTTVHGQGKVALLDIGGSGGNDWQYACQTADQATFASEIVTEMNLYGFDGIGLDMEESTGGTFTTAEWAACVEAIRSALNGVTLSSGPRSGLHPLLTADPIPDLQGSLWNGLASYLDYVNLQVYNAQCAPSPGTCLTGTATGNSTDSFGNALTTFLGDGFSKSQILEGISVDGYAHSAYLSLGTTSSTLSTGAPITSIPVTALAAAIPAGNIVLGTAGSGGTGTAPANSQVFVTSGAAQGATSIPVTSQTPNYAYASGADIYSGYTGPPDCANEGAFVPSEGIAGIAMWDGNAQPQAITCLDLLGANL